MEHLYKLKKDGKTVGYLNIDKGIHWSDEVSIPSNPIDFDTAHPLVCLDRNREQVFDKDEVLVYRGKKNIGEGHIGFHKRFLWWVVDNSNRDNNRESPEDWSQLSLCDVDIELIKD